MMSVRETAALINGGLRWTAVSLHGFSVDTLLNQLRCLTSHGFFNIPSFLVYDMGRMLQEGYQTPLRNFHEKAGGHEDRLLVLRQRYEREFLNRLLQHPKSSRVQEILQTSAQQQAQVERLLVIICGRMKTCLPPLPAMYPGVLRSIDAREIGPPSDAPATIEHHGGPGPEQGQDRFAAWTESFLANLSARMHWHSLIEDQDLFELSHWQDLNDDYARIGCRQIIQLQEKFSPLDLRPLQPRLQQSEVEVRYLDKTHVPSGGVAELSNRGGPENLVASELLYMDETAKGINLFDLRFLEGEVLYYMRDEGALLRTRRALHFIIDIQDLLAFKPAGFDYQFSVFFMGLFLRLYRDFTLVFENDSVTSSFHFVTRESNHDFIRRESRLLGIMLADDIHHGRSCIYTQNEPALEEILAAARKPYVVTVTDHDDAPWRPALTQPHVVSINLVLGDRPTTQPVHAFIPLQGTPWERIETLRSGILGALLD